MNIIFMGTPDIASNILEKIIDSRHNVVLAVTNVDRPQKRSGKLLPSPVKETALKHGIKVYQPTSFKSKETIDYINSIDADIIVVAAYGHILPMEILGTHKYGSVNVHASLLPKYRGASPIQSAIINEEKITGVTIMRMVKELDAGDIIKSREIKIDSDDTSLSLSDKVAKKGAEVLLEVLDDFENGSVTQTKQDDNQATYASIIKKEDGHIDFNQSSNKIDCMVRGLNPWPGTYAVVNDKIIKILETKLILDDAIVNGDYTAGEIITTKSNIYVKTRDSFIEIVKLQVPGKKAMEAKSYLCGAKLEGKFV